MSIRMIIICGNSLRKPLEMFLSHVLQKENSRLNGKKRVQFLYTKKDKHSLKNYIRMSLLPIFGKNFEKIIFLNRIIFFSN